MLAGLDETEIHAPEATPSSSSPRSRTSSSPTVTAKPIRAVGEDSRTPFTGKSLRTRMVEAGMMGSPSSSGASSWLEDSPSARLSEQIEIRAFREREQEGEERLNSPQSQRYGEGSSPRPNLGKSDQVGSPYRRQDACNGSEGEGENGWQEGLSMVPEESYIEDASQLASSPAPRDVSHRSTHRVKENLSTPPSPAPSPSTPSSPASEHQHPQSPTSAPSPSSPETLHQPQSVALQASTATSPKSTVGPSTPPSQSKAPTIHTPRSFARLQMATPARSSPLSRVVNFTPSSMRSDSDWQSPQSEVSTEKLSPGFPNVAESNFSQAEEVQARTADSQSARQDFSTAEADLRPQTPKENKPAVQTPSRFYSPASTSFGTPASQYQTWSSVLGTPATNDAEELSALVVGIDTRQSETFGTPPQHILSAAASVTSQIEKDEKEKIEDHQQLSHGITSDQVETEEEAASSCSSTSSSHHKQQGDLFSTASLASHPFSPPSTQKQAQLNSPSQNFDSPSATRLSRVQLSRLPPNPCLSLTNTAPELAVVAGAFDTLDQLTDTRISRLLSQLSASTARVQELQDELESNSELDELRSTLNDLSQQYQDFVTEAERKDSEMAELVLKLQTQLEARKGKRVAELEKELEEEKRLREVERRDYEVRLQGLLSNPSCSIPIHNNAIGGDEMEKAVELAKTQLHLTLEKDFKVRRAIEQRELKERIFQLEAQLSTSTKPPISAQEEEKEKDQLCKQVIELESELNRRLEQLSDLQDQLLSITLVKDRAQDKIEMLEEQLASSSPLPIGMREDVELEAQFEDCKLRLEEKQEEISHLKETLDLTSAHASGLDSELAILTEQYAQSQTDLEDSKLRVKELESHLVMLENRLRTPSTPPPQPTHSEETKTSTQKRLKKLEQQIANSNLELLKLTRANEALQQDNINFSIALSAKQLELGMVKRNARFALKATGQHANASAITGKVGMVGLAVSKQLPHLDKESERVKAEIKKGGKEWDRENQKPTQMGVNLTRQHARQLLAQRRANNDGGVRDSDQGRVSRKQRLALAT